MDIKDSGINGVKAHSSVTVISVELFTVGVYDCDCDFDRRHTRAVHFRMSSRRLVMSQSCSADTPLHGQFPAKAFPCMPSIFTCLGQSPVFYGQIPLITWVTVEDRFNRIYMKHPGWSADLVSGNFYTVLRERVDRNVGE